MADGEPKEGVLDGGQHLILATYHIVKALEATNNLSDGMKRILAELRSELSVTENGREIDRVVSARDTITHLHSSHSKIWDSNPSVVLEYLNAVDEVRVLAEGSESIVAPRNRNQREISDQAQSILHVAMVRLQEELIHILYQNKQCLGQDQCIIVPVYEELSVSNEDNSVDNASPSHRGSCSTEPEACSLGLIHPDAIPQLKAIAKIMFASRYSQEFRLSFEKFWRCMFDECLTIHDVERVSITEVCKMDWKLVNSKIKKWCYSTKSIIGTYLVSAKLLFDQVLEEHGRTSSICFAEASAAFVSALLDFGQAVALGPHGPEWLFCLLKMYDVLVGLIPDIEALYPEEAGFMIKVEFNELLLRIESSAKLVFTEFGNHIEFQSSTTPFANGGVHPLTKYVTNYISCLAGYCDIVDSLLQDRDAVAGYLKSFTSILVANLENRSELYKDAALKRIFLVNNIHYMVQKVGNSSIRSYFGDEWMRNHICMYRQHAMCYERATWNNILVLLHNDGRTGKAILEKRCQDFAAGFEVVYKNQTGWSVPDPKLREELQISASKTVILAYRKFIHDIRNPVAEKNIKYTEQDLETYILDLLEGSSKLITGLRKR